MILLLIKLINKISKLKILYLVVAPYAIGTIFEQLLFVNLSKKNVFRGLHFQKKPFEQTKLIKVINGSIFDVFVDLREDSNDFGSYSSIELTQDMGWVLIPKGFAHGFKTLEDNTSVLYKVDQYYNPENDSGIIWNDNFLNIDWSLSSDPVLSEKDKNLSNWDTIITELKE